MLSYFHHHLYRTLCPRCALCLLPFFLFFSSFGFVSSYLEKISFPLSSNERISSAPFFGTCTTRPNCASCLPLPANFPFLVLTGSPISLVLLFFPQKSRFPRPANCKKGRPVIATFPSILVALLICCSARNNTHVGDLYPASSNSSVRLVFF